MDPSTRSSAPSLRPGTISFTGSGPTGVESAQTFDLARELVSRMSAGVGGDLPGRDARMLGILNAELDMRLDLPDNRYSVTKSTSLLRLLLEHPDVDADFARLRDAVCVDLGCGALNPLGPSFGLILAGARRGIGIDLEPVMSERHAVRALYHCFAAVIARATKPRFQIDPSQAIARVEGFDLARIAAGDAKGIPTDRLAFVQAPVEAAGLADGSVDLFVSNSFFEHVPDPEAIIASLARLSKPGALGLHAIDGVDHRSYGPTVAHVLEFLRDADRATMLHGCNRIRPLAYAPMFERHGFEVRATRTSRRITLTPSEIASFAEPYRSMPIDQLECVGVRYFVRRR